VKIKGSVKLRRSSKHKPKYTAQFSRTARNKIRQLTRRLPWDKTAEAAINRNKVKLIYKGHIPNES